MFPTEYEAQTTKQNFKRMMNKHDEVHLKGKIHIWLIQCQTLPLHRMIYVKISAVDIPLIYKLQHM